MPNNTTYTVFSNDTAGESRTRKGKAIELAEQALATDPTKTIEVRTNAGTVVWPAPEAVDAPEVTDEAAAPVSNRATPFTRTEVVDGLPASVDGYDLAYPRKNVKAGVYRNADKQYLVVQFDAKGAEILRETPANTTEAREITNRLAAEHAEARAAAKVADQAAKAKAKADKAEAKAKADAEKAAAKAEALAAKEKAAADAAVADETATELAEA